MNPHTITSFARPGRADNFKFVRCGEIKINYDEQNFKKKLNLFLKYKLVWCEGEI